MNPIITLDKEQLELASGLELAWQDIFDFVDVLTDYENRKETAVVPDFIAREIEAVRVSGHRNFEMEARQSIVAFVERVWRERGGGSGGAHYSKTRRRHEGPLIELLLNLFLAIGETPTRSTLFHDITDPIGHRRGRRQPPPPK